MHKYWNWTEDILLWWRGAAVGEGQNFLGVAWQNIWGSGKNIFGWGKWISGKIFWGEVAKKFGDGVAK